jgi:glycerol-3-phosphate dehydrogenase
VIDKLLPHLGRAGPAWTAPAPLPGGNLPKADFALFLGQVARQYPWLPEPLRLRYARAYGTRIERVIGTARKVSDLGEAVLPGLYVAEIDHLRREEWAQSADDILWRRTKLGLRAPRGAERKLDAWLAAHPLIEAAKAIA